MDVALPLLFTVRNAPRTSVWNNGWEGYDAFVCDMSQRYPDVLVPHESRGHHMLVDVEQQQRLQEQWQQRAAQGATLQSTVSFRSTERTSGKRRCTRGRKGNADVVFVDLPDLEALLPADERRVLLLHMARFTDGASTWGHSILLAFDPVRKTQYVVDLSAHFHCGWYRALKDHPLVPGYAVRIVGESPSYRHSPQHRFGEAAGILGPDVAASAAALSAPVCGLLVVLCCLVGVLCRVEGDGVSVPWAVRQVQHCAWRASFDERRELIRACAGWYDAGARLPASSDSLAIFL